MRRRWLRAASCVLVIAGCGSKIDDSPAHGGAGSGAGGSSNRKDADGGMHSSSGSGGRSSGSAGAHADHDAGASTGTGGGSGSGGTASHDSGTGHGGTTGNADSGSSSPADAGGNTSTGSKVPIFVAQGHQGRITISCDDGHTWIADRSADDGVRCFASSGGVDCDHSALAGRGLAYGNGIFTATFGWGEPGHIARSTNGIDWQEFPQTLTYADIAFGNGVFIAAMGLPAISSDGATWTAGPDVGLRVSNYRGIGFGAGSFVITGESTTGRDLAVSTDSGKSWKPPTTRPDECVTNITGSASNDDLIVFGGGSYVCRSADGGDTWASTKVAASGGLTSPPIWTGSEFMVWQNDTLYRSPDAQSWTNEKLQPAGVHIGPVARGKNGTFVAVKADWGAFYDMQAFYRSQDGVSWEILDASAFKGSHPITFIEAGEVDASADCGG